jgi:O-antigen ligase
VTGILFLSVSPFLCSLLFWGAAFKTSWKDWKQNLNREKTVLGCLILIISIGILLRNTQVENIQPGFIGISDYVPFFIFFYLLILKPFNKTEISAFTYATLLIIPQQFILGIGEKYWNWYDRFVFPSPSLPLFDLYIGPMKRGLSTSAGFFNPNILSCFCILVIGMALTVVNEQVQVLRGGRSWMDWTILAIIQKLILSVISLLLAGLLLMWSDSDNGLFGLLWLMLLSALVIWAQWLSKTVVLIIRALFSILSVTALSVVISSFAYPSLSLLPTPLLNLVSKVELSFEDRLPIYNCAVKLTLQKPLFGWGLGRFSPECIKMTNLYLMHSHNIVLQLASELGLLLTSLVIGLIGYNFAKMFYKVLKQETRRKQHEWHSDEIVMTSLLVTLIALVSMHLFDLPLLASYRLNYLFWILLAISYSHVSTVDTAISKS